MLIRIPFVLAALGMFGGVLIGASVLLGDSDHDVDSDLDLDVDHDLDLDHDLDHDLHIDAQAGGGGGILEWSVLPFGSLRFWTFLVESFGLMGSLLTCAAAAHRQRHPQRPRRSTTSSKPSC